MLFGKKTKLIIKNPPTRSNFYPLTVLKCINRKAKSCSSRLIRLWIEIIFWDINSFYYYYYFIDLVPLLLFI